MKDKTLVGIVIGSDSDLPIIQETVNILDYLGVGYDLTIASAHRSPGRVREWVQNMEKRGVEIFIAGAGGAAHLPGVIAAETIVPVIGIPMPTLYFNGQDSLLSIVQMPSGIPVAAVAVGKSGATNAGLFAAQMLGRKYENIAEALKKFRLELIQGVEKKAAKLEQLGIDKYIETM
ncbi:5-(carboxyamino)imidazole ribonucleotide mutase [candidate division FCPU426 bacterium]|nr:5-(carboxyamino)imidazole ribonucleotide mutase [candidate division FCPU426 bacterium]